MEPPMNNPQKIEGSPIIRWSVSFFCIVLISIALNVLGFDLFYNDEAIKLRRLTGYVVILLIGLLSLGAIWRISIAARLLAGLFGIFGVFYLIDEWVVSSEPILFAKRYASASNPLNAVLYFLLIAVPCFLYASGFKTLLEKYLVPGCLIFFLYAAGAFTYAIAKIFNLSGWQYVLVFLPLILLILWLIVQSIWVFYRDRKRGWRIGFVEYGTRTYEERVGKKWVSILLSCESDFREPPLIMRFPGLEDWKRFPTWTEERHALIIERIMDSLNAKEHRFIDADTLREIKRTP
jgi:hypothetical protein